MEPLIVLVYLGVILLFGILALTIARKFHLPHALLLVIIGAVLGHIRYGGATIVEFPEVFLTTLGTLALIMVLFDSTSRFRLKRFDDYSVGALKITFLFLIISVPVFVIAAHLVFGAPPGLAFVFAVLMVGTSPDIVPAILERRKSRILEFLRVESIFNASLAILLPFIILDLTQRVSIVDGSLPENLIAHVLAFLLQLAVGLGAGILVAIIMFKAMRHQYSKTLSPLAVIVSVILSYVLAESLGGNGLLAILALGLFFGHANLKEKETLVVFGSHVRSALEVLVFVLIGIMIDVPLSLDFFFKSFGLFVLLLTLRFLVLLIGIRRTPLEDSTFKEHLFMAFNAPKGIATAVVVFLLSTIRLEGMAIILGLALAMIVYSIIIAGVAGSLRSFFCEDLKEKARTRKGR